jgi:hypothetical protein
VVRAEEGCELGFAVEDHEAGEEADVEVLEVERRLSLSGEFELIVEGRSSTEMGMVEERERRARMMGRPIWPAPMTRMDCLDVMLLAFEGSFIEFVEILRGLIRILRLQ